jgi:hypothetical protein
MAVETTVRRMIKAALKTNVVLTVNTNRTALAAAGEEDKFKVLEQSNTSNRKSLKEDETWHSQQASPQEFQVSIACWELSRTYPFWHR